MFAIHHFLGIIKKKKKSHGCLASACSRPSRVRLSLHAIVDGIGKAMAFEMARKGMNVLLISRTESKLVDAEAELKAACPKVLVEHLAIDYSNFDASLQVNDTTYAGFSLLSPF